MTAVDWGQVVRAVLLVSMIGTAVAVVVQISWVGRDRPGRVRIDTDA